MMCFRDMTFCEAKDCKHFDNCKRALTEEVQASAKKWWGSDDAPIMVYSEKIKCFEEKK